MIQIIAFQVLASSIDLHKPGPVVARAFSCDGYIDTGFDAHLRVCEECRKVITRDMREFADQIEAMR